MARNREISSNDYLRLLHEQQERLKELACINGTTKILNKGKSVEWALEQIVLLLPPAWQYPESTSARITFDNKTFVTTDFVESEWKMAQEFTTVDDEKGIIEVFYLENFPPEVEGPFLKEERDLIRNIASLISGYISSYKARNILGRTQDPKFTQEEIDITPGKMLLQKFLERHNIGSNSLFYLSNYRGVKDILLIANLYDAYSIEGEGRFLTNIINEFRQFNLAAPPRITGASNEEEVFDKLRAKHFDMVIIMLGSQRDTLMSICAKVKNKYPYLPTYLLLNKTEDIPFAERNRQNGATFDNLFIWTGEAKVFSSMVTLLEDKLNIENDAKKGFARALLLVEDSPENYSSYLPILYTLIMEQTNILICEGTHEDNKSIKLRTRPKILLAPTWEDAMNLYNNYKENILCVVSDMSFPKNGELDNIAGYDFLGHVRSTAPTIPVLLQSADPNNNKYAEKLGCRFLDKNSKSVLQDLKSFINTNLGFGQFVFCDEKSNQIAIARSMKEFEHILSTIQGSSIVSHAVKNHFTKWFMARGEMQIAKALSSKSFSLTDDPEEVRLILFETIKEHKQKLNKGRIVGFEEQNLLDETNVVSLIPGSLGGKGRGLAFINTLIYSFEIGKLLPDINIKTPITSIIGTDEFDLFMEKNNLWNLIKEEEDYKTLQNRFLGGKLSDTLESELYILLRQIHKPLAVRSSSLFEDSLSRPFSGLFSTFILPNNQPDIESRFKQLTDAIKLVFASIYSKNSRTYFKAIHFKVEQEKMAVVIQEVVGNRFGETYYPHISGTAQSYNFYPVAHIKPEDGFSVIAVGLGQYVVEGDKAFRFCPVYPTLDIVSHTDIYKNSQTKFYAVDLAKKNINLLDGENAGLVSLDICDAERHKTLQHMASVFYKDNDTLVPGLDSIGPRVVNFADILKYNYIPLASTIRTVLEVVSEATGNPSEIEFAVDLTKDKNGKATFYLLQIKPLFGSGAGYEIDPDSIDYNNLVLKSEKSMGNGVIDNITDVIFVGPRSFDKHRTVEMAKEIEQLNDKMIKENRRYLLVGPGRWGTRDVFLGIPVQWSQISNAKVVVEVGLPGFHLDASLGSHFFHNVTSMNVGYFSVNSETDNGIINWKLIEEQEPIQKGEFFSHVRFKKPLLIRMDGKKGISVVSTTPINTGKKH